MVLVSFSTIVDKDKTVEGDEFVVMRQHLKQLPKLTLKNVKSNFYRSNLWSQ